MKTRIKNSSISKLAIFSGSLLIAASAALILAPVIKSNAAEQSTDVNVTVNPIISISLDKSTLSFDIAPTVAGVFDSGSIVATVDTNSSGGYELYFSSEDSTTAMTSLVTSSTITSDFTGTVTSSTMANNKWGYSLDATNFSKIPALANQTKIKDLNHVPTSSEKETTVTIGTKIDSTLPSGTYSKKVVFSAIAHPSASPTLHDISTMQQMTSEICAVTTTPTTSATALDWDGSYHGDNTRVPRKSLKDTRDNKYYLVSKLADGNCWMSQNLELILNKNTALTNETTDLNSKTSWTPENSTLTTVPDAGTWPNYSEAAAAAAYSYYPNIYLQGGTTPSNAPTASGVEYDWEKAGSLYNWYAATAGSGTASKSSGEADDSICPKGWKLPLGMTQVRDKSWHKLIYTTYSASTANLLGAPFNFTRAGNYAYENSRYLNGSIGWFWTSTPYGVDRGYELNSSDSGNHVQGLGKSFGLSVRCVAR